MSRAAYITQNDQGEQNRVVAALRAEMEGAGVSDSSLAGGIGMRQSTFEKRMRGASDFYVCELAAICAYLNIPFGKILTG